MESGNMCAGVYILIPAILLYAIENEDLDDEQRYNVLLSAMALLIPIA